MTEGFEKPIVLSKDRSIIETLTVGGLTVGDCTSRRVWIIIGGIQAIALRSPIRTLSDAFWRTKAGKTAGVSLLNQLWKSSVTEHDALMDTTESALLKRKKVNGSILICHCGHRSGGTIAWSFGNSDGYDSTFEIITEHGTGDPKMLSGGISEALITTHLDWLLLFRCFCWAIC